MFYSGFTIVVFIEGDVYFQALWMIGGPSESFPFHAESIPIYFGYVIGNIPEVFIDFEIIGSRVTGVGVFIIIFRVSGGLAEKDVCLLYCCF